jgi:DNA-binding response OmpR family regulator
LAVARPTILVVEDEPDVGAFVATALEEQFDVVVARDTDEALTAAQRSTPALVLLDLRMPGTRSDGFDFVERYQSAAAHAAAPIIVISALPLDQQRALEPRVAAFLPKPFSLAELTELVGDVLRRR